MGRKHKVRVGHSFGADAPSAPRAVGTARAATVTITGQQQPVVSLVGVSATGVAGTSSAGQINWHPGHYLQTGRAGSSLSQSYRLDTLYPTYLADPDVLGVAVQFKWKDFEQTEGDVTPGLTLIGDELAYLASLTPPRRLWISFRDEKQNETFATRANLFPEYLNTTYGAIYDYIKGVLGSEKTFVTWDQDNSGALAAYKAMWTNLANGLKEDPNYALLEGIRFSREDSSQCYDTAYISQANFIAYAKDALLHLRTQFPDKAIIVNSVDISGDAVVVGDFLDYCTTIDVLPGHGDTLPRGATGNLSADYGSSQERKLRGVTQGYTDRRITTAIWMAVENSELGQGAFYTYDVSELFPYMDTIMEARYMFWDDWAGAGSPFLTNILPYITTHPVTHTDYPSHYP